MLSSDMAVMTAVNPQRSRLESLPTELLEQIFLRSLNVNLLLASSHLGTVLSSTSTKTAVVLKVFPSNASRDLENHRELEQAFWAENVWDTNTAIEEL